MMWEEDGSVKMRHYTGSDWESAETLTDPAQDYGGYYPNLKLGVEDGQLAWVYTACHTPYGLLAESRSLTPTAVDLVSFNVTATASGLLLAWETAQETTTLGFNVYRAEGGTAPESSGATGRLNEQLIPARVPGNPAGASYAYLDVSVELGVPYQYWLETVDIHGKATRHGPVAGQLQASSAFVYVPLVRR
jgi:hypothetical protein